jgi:hypothetical protein
MKKYPLFIIAIFSLAIFFACSENQTVNDFTKTFEGKIGDEYEIVAKIKLSKNQLEGVYFYEEIGVDLIIKGSVDTEGILILNEFDSNGNQTGVFKGNFSNTGISGNWSKPDGSKSKAFYLKESEIDYDSMSKSLSSKNLDNSKVEFPPSDFRGSWSDEGDVSANSRLELEINQIADKIEGSITFYKWDENGDIKESSGLYALTGSVIGETVYIQLHSQGGTITEGKLTRKEDYLKFSQNQNADPRFPIERLVWKQSSN